MDSEYYSNSAEIAARREKEAAAHREHMRKHQERMRELRERARKNREYQRELNRRLEASREKTRKVDRHLRIMRVAYPILCAVAGVLIIVLTTYLIVTGKI